MRWEEGADLRASLSDPQVHPAALGTFCPLCASWAPALHILIKARSAPRGFLGAVLTHLCTCGLLLEFTSERQGWAQQAFLEEV